MVTPVELPSLKLYQDGWFDIQRFQFGDANHGGAGQTAEWTDPIWQFEFGFAGFPTRQDREVWRRFLTRLEGMKTPVLAFDPERRVPLDYYDDAGEPMASGSPWGSPVVAAFDRAASTFDLTGWTANQQLYSGDYISFQDTGGRWHLHRLDADALANGSGAATVQVQPRPARNLVHGGATLRVRDACCTAVLRWNIDAFKWGADKGSPLQITGHQVTRSFL